MGTERHCLQDCEPGDWVMAGAEYPGETKLMMAPAIDAAAITDPDPPPPTPADYGPFRLFERVWAEPHGVFTCWRRVR